MIQLLKLSGYTNIIATASSHHHSRLFSLGAKSCIDYHCANLGEQILRGLSGRKLEIVVDCIGERSSVEAYAAAVAEGARVAVLMPVKDKSNGVGCEGRTHLHVDFPAWTKEALPKAKLIPVYYIKIQDVSRCRLSA